MQDTAKSLRFRAAHFWKARDVVLTKGVRGCRTDPSHGLQMRGDRCAVCSYLTQLKTIERMKERGGHSPVERRARAKVVREAAARKAAATESAKVDVAKVAATSMGFTIDPSLADLLE